MKFTSIFFTASAEDLRALAQSITNLRVSEQNQNLFGFWSERKQIRQSQTSKKYEVCLNIFQSECRRSSRFTSNTLPNLPNSKKKTNPPNSFQ